MLAAVPAVATIASFGSGESPSGSLVIYGGNLYGTAIITATNTAEIYAVPLTGGTPSVLHRLDPVVDASLSFASGGSLYGSYYTGGASGDGAIFSLPVTGGTPTILASFGGTNGIEPGELTFSGNTIYGATGGGGANGLGTIFSLPLTGGTPTILASLGASSAGGAVNSIIVAGGTLYFPSISGPGAIYSLPITGGTPTELTGLTNASGQDPRSLVLSGSTLYCTTVAEGPSDAGDVFSLPVSGGAPTVLASTFGTLSDGLPVEGPANLVVSNGILYGTTVLGYYAFSLPIGGGVPTLLADLGNQPSGNSLLYSGGALYGTTVPGDAAIFKIPILSASSISLTSSRVPVYHGEHVTLTATVAASENGGGAPTGTVTFYDNDIAIGDAQVADGAAVFTDTTLPVGSNSISATYNGDTDFAAASTASTLIATVHAHNPGTTPTITSAISSASTHASAITLSVTGADTGPGGAAGLKYTWTAIHLPAGAKTPTFNINGINAAKSVTAVFSKDGGYILRCEAKNAAGNAATTDIFVTVTQTATALRIEPHDAHIAENATLQYTGTVLDQFNHPMRTAQTLTFLVATGPGSITPTGLFSATSIAGPVTIELEADDLTGTVGLQVIS